MSTPIMSHSKIQNQSKIQSLLKVLLLVDEGRSTLADLVSELNVTPRSMHRYINELRGMGFYIETDPTSKRLVFLEGGHLLKQSFSADEVAALQGLQQLAAALPSNLAASAQRALDRMLLVAPKQKLNLALPLDGVEMDVPTLSTFSHLQRAYRERRAVHFSYVDRYAKRSRRHVEPFGFVISGGRVFLIGRDRDKLAQRTFAIDSISDLEVLPSAFNVPGDFDLANFGRHSTSGLYDGPPTATVTVRFDPAAARYALAARIAHGAESQLIEDGRTEATIAIREPEELVRWILGWGAEAEVLSPESIRAAVAERANRIFRQHAG